MLLAGKYGEKIMEDNQNLYDRTILCTRLQIYIYKIFTILQRSQDFSSSNLRHQKLKKSLLKRVEGISFHISTQTFDDMPVAVVTNILGTKQQAIEHAIKILHVHPEEIVAVGDGKRYSNDLGCGNGCCHGECCRRIKICCRLYCAIC